MLVSTHTWSEVLGSRQEPWSPVGNKASKKSATAALANERQAALARLDTAKDREQIEDCIKWLALTHVREFETALEACSRCREWPLALEMLARMTEQGLPPSQRAYALAITSCTSSQPAQWELAKWLLEEMVARGVPPNAGTCGEVIDACSHGGQPDTAVTVFDQMVTQWATCPTALCCLAAIFACHRAKRWEKALAVFDSMTSYGLVPDAEAYGAAISACGRCGQWDAVNSSWAAWRRTACSCCPRATTAWPSLPPVGPLGVPRWTPGMSWCGSSLSS